MAGLISGALGGTVGKSATVAPIVGLVGPQAAVTLAVLGGVFAGPIIVKAAVQTVAVVGKAVVKTVAITAEVVGTVASAVVETSVDTVRILCNAHYVTEQKSGNASERRNSRNENCTNSKSNNESKQSQQNTKTNKQTQSKQTGTARNAGDDDDDPRRRRNLKTTRNCQDETSDETEPHTGASHLHSRTAVHTVRFAGEIRRAADRSGHHVRDLIEDGASTIRDGYIRPPTPDSQLQRAHVLRFRDNFEMLREHYPELYRILCRHAGHTQRIPRVFNVFHRIGGRIDKLQYGWILKLSEVDFSAGPTAANLAIFEAYRQEVLDLYDSEIRLRYERNYSEEDMAEIRRAKEMMENTTNEELFENALEGYNLEHRYNNPRKRL
ncbi:uncharacterized protein LOC120904361 [Anopheles arabiensis]|uniref:Uncharacterized protein n=3 Tax=gambiae species complex TaxID=44542 RepID=A0A1S4H835_ANOGA|nr:uncharacterized protein LOC120904361 [Anopheles arabiensis]